VVKGRKELLVAGAINRFIPNPTFDPVARPGCLDQYYRGNNPKGHTIREAFGRSSRSAANTATATRASR